ncbi:hypothetical protein [Actinoplanes sp. DH11]|uniref:hypothetical protein n=1 Tax=Actinoplanes sp. DH11 TaxID=2857011 RepID=UPI001E642CAB|nr:hypothetical protein [Actinoplanes sp. DH11]
MSADRFFDLLPAVIRTVDADRGHPLRDLLRVIAREADTVEDDVRRMYADLFIETCEQWVVPYLGDLVGYRWLPVPQGRAAGALVPRRAVADTIRHRRRKGTRSVLEDLALAVSGWPAIVCDSDDADPLCAGAPRGQITVRTWRLPVWPLTRIRPFYQGDRVNSYHLSVLGNDAPMFIRPQAPTDDDPDRRPRPPRRLSLTALRADLPAHYGEGRSICLYENGSPIAVERIEPMSLRGWDAEVFGDRVGLDPALGRVLFPERYDLGRITASLWYGFAQPIGGGEYQRGEPASAGAAPSLFRTGHLTDDGTALIAALHGINPFAAHLRELIDPAVLTADPGDPGTAARLCAELNRLMVAHDLRQGSPDLRELDEEGAQLAVTVDGGPGRIRLNRLLLEANLPRAVRRAIAVVRVRAEDAQPVIIEAVRGAQQSARPPLHLVVELCDSGLYVEPIEITLPDQHTFELRAADGCRPTLLLPARRRDIDDMIVECGTGCRVILDGLMIAGHPVRIAGDPAEVLIRHCTLVPGWEISDNCEPGHGDELSLILTDRRDHGLRSRPRAAPAAEELLATCLTIQHSIVGTIIVQRDEVRAEPIRLDIRGSVVDATRDRIDAIAAPNHRHAHAIASIADSTVIGGVRLHAIELGENSIFTGAMSVHRRQIGCLRYCFVATAQRTPRRFACRPDAAAPGVRPKIMTKRYGRPDYCRLADNCPAEILTGADDESEMGVFHDTYTAQRRANLERALLDHVPLGWGFTVENRS